VGYAAWAIVWLTSVGEIAGRDPFLGWIARVTLVMSLVGFVFAGPLAEESHPLRNWVATAVLGASAFAMFALDPRFGAPILLGIFAGMLGSRLGLQQLIAIILVLAIPVFAVFRLRWQLGVSDSLLATAGLTTLQLFAGLVAHSTVRAEAAAAQLRTVNAELLATRMLLEQSARNEERLRLSRDLHDVAGHTLTALKLNLAAATMSDRADSQRLAVCTMLVDELMGKVREVVRHSRAGESIDLLAAIQQLAAPLLRPTLHLEIASDVQINSIELAEAILRIVQEGLTNAARHSNAQNIWVVLHREAESVNVQLRDDGRASIRVETGIGLSGMRERLQALGGALEIAQTEAGGVRLDAKLPLA
jgi:signal transduction histidine kinase